MTRSDTPLSSTDFRRAAMDLLARREHSRAELMQKLSRKFPESVDQLPPVFDQLEQDGLLSDERFAFTYARYRRMRGFGPLLIRQELAGKGVSQALVSACLADEPSAWIASLQTLMSRKSSGELSALSTSARQKLFRFCLSRGFSAEQISKVLRGNLEL